MSTLAFIGRRLLLLIPVLFGLSLLTFTISRIVPGDPVMLAAGPQASREEIRMIAEEFGLDRPLPVQYVTYIRGLFRGNWGRSLLSRRPVAEDLAIYFPATLELVIVALGLAIGLGIPLGVASAVSQGRWPDTLSRLFALTGVSLPRFFLALLLQLALAMQIGLLPIGGRFPTILAPPARITGMLILDSLLQGEWTALAVAFRHLLLPAFALSLSPLATLTRMMRAGMLDALGQDYVRTARAFGVPERVIFFKYVLKNAVLSTVTLIGLYFGFLLSGSVLVEAVFDWPGIGLYAVNSVVTLDFMPIMGVTLVIGLVFVISNLVTDLLYGVVDPRIRLAEG